MSCHSHIDHFAFGFNSIFEFLSHFCNGDVLMLLSFFLFALFSSFTHCIGMCGPIALSQASMRLMNIDSTSMKQCGKVFASMAPEYYFGKSLAYAFLGFFTVSVTFLFKDQEWFIILRNFIIFLLILFFLLQCVHFLLNYKSSISFHYFANFLKAYSNFIYRVGSLYKKNSIFHNLLIGWFLGFIPCGLIYFVLGMLLVSVEDPIWGAFLMFIFGLGTFPGLFIISYFGISIVKKYKKSFEILYLITLFFNIYLLIRYVKIS